MTSPFVRRARLEAAEATLETERDGYRELMERYVALEQERDRWRMAAEGALSAAQAWHMAARQVQLTMLNMPYWASKPAQEATDAHR